jgi:hypothetical protein
MSDIVGWQTRCQEHLHLIYRQAIPPSITLLLAAVAGTACPRPKIRLLERLQRRLT